jgi:hypothetical protein
MKELRGLMNKVSKGLDDVSDAMEEFFKGVDSGTSIQESSANGITLKTMIKGKTVTLWVNGRKVYERDVSSDGR